MSLRENLVSVALKWQEKYGVAPQVTSALAEYDAAILVGCPEESYSQYMQGRTAVSRGFDFEHEGQRYQVKSNRPSGRPGSPVTLVGKPKNYDWDCLIWIHYTTDYEIQEAWLWNVEEYRQAFEHVTRLSPSHMRQGRRLK